MTADIHAPGRREAAEPTFGELVASASHDLSELIRGEMALAKAELRADVRAAAAAGVLFAIAAVFGVFLLVMLLIAAAEGLVAAGLFRWAAYLVVAGALLVLAGLFGLVGLRFVRGIKPPARTIETTKDTLAWARRPTRLPSRVVTDGNRVARTMPPGER